MTVACRAKFRTFLQSSIYGRFNSFAGSRSLARKCSASIQGEIVERSLRLSTIADGKGRVSENFVFDRQERIFEKHEQSNFLQQTNHLSI